MFYKAMTSCLLPTNTKHSGRERTMSLHEKLLIKNRIFGNITQWLLIPVKICDRNSKDSWLAVV